MSKDKERFHDKPLMIELNQMYKELHRTLSGAKIFGKSLTPIIEPVERIVMFVAKVVEDLEETKERIDWLEKELNKRDQEGVSTENE